MDLPERILSFWEGFAASVGQDVSSGLYEVFHFADEESGADKLAARVLAGTKRATASLVWSLESENKRIPKAGDLSVVTNWSGEPRCIIETKSVAVVPFEEVSAEHAAAEGGGDGSLREWREVHWSYFGRECAKIGREPTLNMPVACERFEVVYPKAVEVLLPGPSIESNATAKPAATALGSR